MLNPRQSEPTINSKLGELLIQRHPAWNETNIHVQKTGIIRDHPSWEIDIVIDMPGGQPVAVECKLGDGGVADLKSQITARMGKVVDPSGKTIEAGIAVIYPVNQTVATLELSEVKYAVYQLTANDEVSRYPHEESEFLFGSMERLADVVELVSLSEKRIKQGETLLANGVKDCASHLLEQPNPVPFGNILHQEEGLQTTRMAVAIIVNAFVFHYSIEDVRGIPPISDGQVYGVFRKSHVMRLWGRILDLNYWPIFSIARSLLNLIPARVATRTLSIANECAEDLLHVGATTFHDLSARMFQTLISDRKLLATFYTLPAFATLLAELALECLDVNWHNMKEVKNLKIADFACGTGALLSAVQRGIYRRVRRTGLDDAELHPHAMKSMLLGTDIMPAAVHLTASTLSSSHPGVAYDHSLICTLPYGKDAELSVRRSMELDETYLGALDLIGDEHAYSVFKELDSSLRTETGGKLMVSRASFADEGSTVLPVDHETFDVVIMNPPFTRPTNHEADKSDIPVPSFAGFGTSNDEQHDMSLKLARASKLFGHGNVGLASNFMDLAHVKLKKGGVLALVLPFTFLSGRYWKPARDTLSRFYKQIRVVSIATHEKNGGAFSADTSIAECLVIAQRRNRDEIRVVDEVGYINLSERPRTILDATEIVLKSDSLVVSSSFGNSGVAGTQDHELVQSLLNLVDGKLRLPRHSKTFDLPIVPLQKLVRRGMGHRDINGKNRNGTFRGAFDIAPIDGIAFPAYPATWNHNAPRERSFIVKPDTRGVVREGMNEKAVETWEQTASQLHSTLDFRFDSQSLAMCLTEQPCIGGTAWPNLLPHDEAFNEPLVLWSNSTFGLMVFWWMSSRQQLGRGRLSITRIPNLPVLDVSTLTSDQLSVCHQIFRDMKHRTFLPANEAYQDETRHDLDAAVWNMLGLPTELLKSIELLRLKWCSEPSVHGGKRTRPRQSTSS